MDYEQILNREWLVRHQQDLSPSALYARRLLRRRTLTDGMLRALAEARAKELGIKPTSLYKALGVDKRVAA